MMPKTEPFPPRSWIPAAITAANIACGFVAVLMVADGRYDGAIRLLVLAVFLDMLDGRVARALRATSVFGKQLDSFCDVVSFGVAPAFLAWATVLREAGPLGLAAALAYLLAGVYRLSRFNLTSDEHVKEQRTTGMPIPIGASYLMALGLMRERIEPWWGVPVVVLIAALMASRWRLPGLSGRSVVTAMLIVGIFNYLAVVGWPNWYTVGWWNLWNVFILAAARNEDRRPMTEAMQEQR